MAKFTEGPWVLTMNYWGGATITGADGSKVARIEGKSSEKMTAEIRSIAFLIAAAPEMYEALEALQSSLPLGEGLVTLVDDVLAKARGEL